MMPSFARAISSRCRVRRGLLTTAIGRGTSERAQHNGITSQSRRALRGQLAELHGSSKTVRQLRGVICREVRKETKVPC